MGIIHHNGVSIKAISACVPRNKNINLENKIIPASKIQSFIDNVGVEETRISDENTCASDLCYQAADKLLDKLSINRNEIGVLVFVSQTPDHYFLPNTACILQERLGLSQETLSFDVPLGCSGYVYGLSILSAFLSSGQLKYGLLLAGDTISKIVDKNDQSTALLFGDAGSATLLSYEEGSNIHYHMGTDGSGHQAIMASPGGFRSHVSDKTTFDHPYLHLDGFDVFSFGITEVPKTCKALLSNLQIEKTEIDFAVFHQANKMMNEKIRKKLDFPLEKVPYSLQKFGNTSSASIPLTIVTNLEPQLENKKLLMCGFGVGLSWGTAYTVANNLTILPLIEHQHYE